MPTHTAPRSATAAADPLYQGIVDLARYPIHDLHSAAGRALIQQCQEALTTDGACVLEGFITPEAVDAMVAIAHSLDDKAWVTDRPHNVYFEEIDTTVAPTHPRAHLVRSAKHGIAYDHIPADAPMRILYESDDLTRFIATVLDKPVLYRSADPLDALQITKFFPQEELGWHFDRSEFSITVMYEPAEQGGLFEYVPGLRTETDECYPEVEQVLQGDPSRVKLLSSAPGTLAFFRGRYAMHRVTPVIGNRARINSVLTYGTRPDMRLNDLTSQLFYGRTSPQAA